MDFMTNQLQIIELRKVGYFPVSSKNKHISEEMAQPRIENCDILPGIKGVTSFICDQCKIAFPKKYILVRHRLQSHKANSLELKIKSVMVEICDICNETFNSPEDLKRHDDEDHRLTNNIEVISDEYKISEYPEERETTKSVWTKGETSGYQGMTIKGGSVAYKDACTALKTQFVKGKVFKDLHGRQLKIIEVSRNKPIEVEVTTLSKKTNERKGKAQIHMWEPTKKETLHNNGQFALRLPVCLCKGCDGKVHQTLHRRSYK